MLPQTIWHGVPMVGLPGMMDQPWNVRKADYWGFGIALPSVYAAREDEVYAALMRVLSEPQFAEAARLAQARLRAGKKPGVARAIGPYIYTYVSVPSIQLHCAGQM
jgi:UDP:flavonoid glycosyltransferase YjiC (YdhE family)